MRSVGKMIGAPSDGEYAAAPEVWRLAFRSTAPQDLLLAIVTQQRDVEHRGCARQARESREGFRSCQATYDTRSANRREHARDV